jgi:hypothetical protein
MEQQMNTKLIVTLALATATGSTAAASASSSGSVSSGNSESSATFTGNSGLLHVDGDTIEARNGELRVNGIPYGRVTDASVIKYTARGNNKTVTVNGVPREPISKRGQ